MSDLDLATGTVYAPHSLHRDRDLEGSIRIRATVAMFRVTGDSTRPLRGLGTILRLDDGEILPTSLVATDAPGLAPSPFQYRADFYLEGVEIPPAVFNLPTGATLNLLDLVNLALAPSILPVSSAADRAAVEAAALRAEIAAHAAEQAAAGQVGAGGYSLDVPASAEWSIPHLFGRRPAVTVVVNGEQVDASVTYPEPASRVLVTWPFPVTGTIILT